MPDDITGGVKGWRDLMLRLQQLRAKDSGVTVTTIQFTTERGMPVWWAILGQKNVEPAAAAKAFVDCLTGNMDT